MQVFTATSFLRTVSALLLRHPETEIICVQLPSSSSSPSLGCRLDDRSDVPAGGVSTGDRDSTLIDIRGAANSLMTPSVSQPFCVDVLFYGGIGDQGEPCFSSSVGTGLLQGGKESWHLHAARADGATVLASHRVVGDRADEDGTDHHWLTESWCAQLQRALCIVSLFLSVSPVRTRDMADGTPLSRSSCLGHHKMRELYISAVPYVPERQWVKDMDGFLGTHQYVTVCGLAKLRPVARVGEDADAAGGARLCKETDSGCISNRSGSILIDSHTQRKCFYKVRGCVDAAHGCDLVPLIRPVGITTLLIRVAALLNANLPPGPEGDDKTVVLVLHAPRANLITTSSFASIPTQTRKTSTTTGASHLSVPSAPCTWASAGCKGDDVDADLFAFMKLFTTRRIMPCVSLDVIASEWSTSRSPVGVLPPPRRAPRREKTGGPRYREAHSSNTITAESFQLPDNVCCLSALGTSYHIHRSGMGAQGGRGSCDFHNIVFALDIPVGLWRQWEQEEPALTDCCTARWEESSMFAAVADVVQSIQHALSDLVADNCDMFTFPCKGRHQVNECVGEEEGDECNERRPGISARGCYTKPMLVRSISDSISFLIAQSTNMDFVHEAERLLFDLGDDHCTSLSEAPDGSSPASGRTRRYSVAELRWAVEKLLLAQQ